MKKPVLYVVVPCYNEQEVLPVTKDGFLNELKKLIGSGKIAPESRILYVDDGSSDDTWAVMQRLSEENERISAVRLSRNRGHQNALLAGLMTAKDQCDVTISIDCDGQDDIDAMDAMVDEYLAGCEIVYGVRSSRATDSAFKRGTAHMFYKFMGVMGAEVVYDHADYRLVSSRALEELAKFKEVNLFLRGMVPLVGFRSSCVEYERHERIAGESKYPLKKMIALAVDGITSLSVKPLRLITGLGVSLLVLSFIGLIWSLIASASGWITACTVVLACAVQLICLGVVGEYIGKIYMEVKQRPRYIISERTSDTSCTKTDT